jgi:serine/threonine-protein kinase
MRPGALAGHYEILSHIGRGGMGEVWKARDNKLRRDVALKTLPAEFARDPDRVARFQREARSLATLSHPNIAIIHGIEEHADEPFLVLEFIEGSTLAERLERGRVPVAEALDIARQIADALEAAHDKGVVHRDLKPANIKITPEARVKVLDFGLAKNLVPLAGESATHAELQTEIGTVMGTAPYMSPEQLRGEATGRQADIWSLGVILYEMLTGDSPFLCGTGSETIAKVLGAQPDYSRLPAATPAAARRVLLRCLQKDPKRRLQHAGDVRLELEDALAAHAGGPETGAAAARPIRSYLLPAGALAFAALGAVTAWTLLARPPPAVEVARLSIPFRGQPNPQPFGTRDIAVAADGSQVAYATKGRVFVRRISDRMPISFEQDAEDPFFSPDGEWLGYFDPDLKKVPSGGGSPTRVVATSERPAGASWGKDGKIVYATSAGLFRVSDSGGAPEVLAKPDPSRKERLFAWPQLLPGERSVLFTRFTVDPNEPPQTLVLDLKTLESRVVLTGGTAAQYSPTGHLVYVVGQTLNAIPFDLKTLMTRGTGVQFADAPVGVSRDNGAADFALADNGTLAFISSTAALSGARNTLAWVDRQGVAEPIPMEPGAYVYPRVSPDGTRIALDVPGANRDVWIWDLRRTSLTRLTDSPNEDSLPLWSRDGRRVFFLSLRLGSGDVFSQAADGSGDARPEYVGPGFKAPNALSPDGSQLIVLEKFHDISVVDLARHELKPLLRNDVVHWTSDLSPDGHWLAYEANESGDRVEIFLRPFPDVNVRREKVSINGGRYPRWGPAGSGELYYVDLEGAMMAASVELEPALVLGAVRKLFDYVKPPPGVSGRPYDVAPDGRFLVTNAAPPSGDEVVDVSVVLHWFEELRAQVR